MAIEELNQYKGTFPTGSVSEVVAESMIAAATLLTDVLTGSEPTLLQTIKKGIKVLVPSALVHFITEVSPVEAIAGLCIATPLSFTVEDGTEVIFSAIPAVGWVFDHWERNGVLIAEAVDAVTVIAITAGTPSNELVTYTAVFTPTP